MTWRWTMLNFPQADRFAPPYLTCANVPKVIFCKPRATAPVPFNVPHNRICRERAALAAGGNAT